MQDTAFSKLGLSAPLQQALSEAGYQQPTPIQQQAIPPLLDGADLLGIAQTGTGKTAAFCLPILDALIRSKARAKARQPLALVLAPTRELAVQIQEELARFARHSHITQTLVFGGVGANPQIQALRRGVDIVVATPGRLLDLAGARHVDLGAIRHLVLDEADRLLDMGFVRDVRRIIAMTPRSRQSLLFSATMPTEVAQLAADFLVDPQRVEVTPKQVTVDRIEQRVVMIDRAHKRQALAALFRLPEVDKAIVFTRTKHGADKVARQLLADGIEAAAIHGNKSQNARQRALARFKAGEVWALVATDIAARGIDIEGVTHVFNHELPHEPESYVHRIGRTGRAGASGTAWSLVDESEQPRLKQVERLIRFPIERATLAIDTSTQRSRESEDPERPSGQHPSSAAQRTPQNPPANGGTSSAGRRRRKRRRSRPAGASGAKG